MDAGGTPNLATMPASSKVSPLRRSSCTTRLPVTHCPRSLSGVQITTCSTRSSAAATWAAEPSASSASYSTMAHVVTPMATNASSSTGVWRSSSGGIPSLVLYPGHRSLRKLSITWSDATPTWVAPSCMSCRVDESTPCTAANGLGSSWRAACPKCCRNSS